MIPRVAFHRLKKKEQGRFSLFVPLFSESNFVASAPQIETFESKTSFAQKLESGRFRGVSS